MGYSCPNPQCAWRGRVYASPVARRLTVRGSSFALEVITQIGYWRFWKRWTVAQIHGRKSVHEFILRYGPGLFFDLDQRA